MRWAPPHARAPLSLPSGCRQRTGAPACVQPDDLRQALRWARKVPGNGGASSPAAAGIAWRRPHPRGAARPGPPPHPHAVPPQRRGRAAGGTQQDGAALLAAQRARPSRSGINARNTPGACTAQPSPQQRPWRGCRAVRRERKKQCRRSNGHRPLVERAALWDAAARRRLRLRAWTRRHTGASTPRRRARAAAAAARWEVGGPGVQIISRGRPPPGAGAP